MTESERKEYAKHLRETDLDKEKLREVRTKRNEEKEKGEYVPKKKSPEQIKFMKDFIAKEKKTGELQKDYDLLFGENAPQEDDKKEPKQEKVKKLTEKELDELKALDPNA